MALQDNKSTSASIVSTASVTSQQSTVKADVITSSSSGSTSSQFQRLKVNSCNLMYVEKSTWSTLHENEIFIFHTNHASRMYLYRTCFYDASCNQC